MHGTSNRFVVALVALLAALLALPAVSLAADEPPAPAVITRPATDVAGTTATLHADVTTNGTDTTAYLIYGTALGQLTRRTPDVALGAGPGTLPVTAAVTGLTPGTKYVVVAVAENDDWVVSGDAVTFDTQPPPEFLGSSVSDLTYRSATLHLNVATHGQPVTISGTVGTGARLGRLPGPGVTTPLNAVTSFGPVAVAADGDVAIPVAGLTPGTGYNWAATVTGPNGQGTVGGGFRTESLMTLSKPRIARTKVVYGSHVAITGGVPKAGLVVTLAEQVAPFTGAIVPLTGTTATADATGAYGFDLRAVHSARYGVTAEGAAALSPLYLTRLDVFPAVTAKLKRAKRHRFVVSGGYQPRGVAAKASLYRRGAGRVGTAVASKGAFRFPARALKPGKYEVRVSPPAGSALIAGKSALITVPRR